MTKDSAAEHRVNFARLAKSVTDKTHDTLTQKRDLDGGVSPSVYLGTVKFDLARQRSVCRPTDDGIVYSLNQVVELTVEKTRDFMCLLCDQIANGGELGAAAGRFPTVFWAVDFPGSQQHRPRLYEMPQASALIIVPKSQDADFQSFVRRDSAIATMTSGAGLGRSFEVSPVENSSAGLASALEQVLSFTKTLESIFLPDDAQGVFIVNGPTK